MAQAPRWVMVASDALPIFREPEAEVTEVYAFLMAGQLLERRDDQEYKVEPPKPPDAGGHGGPPLVPGKGPLVRVFPSPGEIGFTFSGSLVAAPASIPPRAVLCRAVAGATPPAVAEAACMAQARFVTIGTGATGAPRFVLAIADTGLETSRLVLLDSAALGGKDSAVRGSLEVGRPRALRQVPLGDEHMLFVVEEYVRAGNLTGTRHAFLVVDPAGALTRQLEVPGNSAEPTGDVAIQRRYTVDIADIGPAAPEGGPTVKVKGSEVAQVIATAAIRSRKEVSQSYRWDRAQRRFSMVSPNKERNRK